MIPKKIHYCWFGGKQKPPLVLKCFESWEKYLSGWEFVEWNENNSPVCVSYVSEALKAKRFAFAADYVRFFALREHGGIYLDTDVEIVKPLDPLLENSFFLGKESDEYINVAVAGACPGNSVVSRILDEMEHLDTRFYDSIPLVLKRFFEKYPECFSNTKIYKKESFYPYNPYDNKRNAIAQLFYSDILDDTYAIHHWAKSWNYTFAEKLFKKLKTFVQVKI